MKHIEEFVALLKAYQDNRTSLDEIVPVFEKLSSFHDFWHYISDDDIRAKDGEYAKMQDDELAKFIAAVEAGDYERANRITFLGVSSV